MNSVDEVMNNYSKCSVRLNRSLLSLKRYQKKQTQIGDKAQRLYMPYCLNEINQSYLKGSFELPCFPSRHDSDRILLYHNSSNNVRVQKMIQVWASTDLTRSLAHQQLIINMPDDTLIIEITICERHLIHDLLLAPSRRALLADEAAHLMTMN